MDITDVANQTGLRFETLSRLENGHTLWLKTLTLRLLTKVLKQPAYFLGCFDLFPTDTLGQHIKKARLYHCLNIEKFSVELKVDIRTIRYWEQDVYEPTKENLRKLESYMAILEM